MKTKAYILLLVLLATAQLGRAANGSGDPLQSADIALCLRPLRLAERPRLSDAVETVKRLTSFTQKQEGTARRAVDALVFIFKDLFLKEHELTAAENAMAQAERKALGKEQLATRTETVGSPLTGPNPRLAAMFRKEASDIRGQAGQRYERALSLMKEKITAYNVSVGYFQSQGNMEVVIALQNSLFAIVDRHLPDFHFTPTVSREWVTQMRSEWGTGNTTRTLTVR